MLNLVSFAVAEDFLFLRGVPYEIALGEKCGPVEGVAELAVELLAVEHISDLICHLSVRLVDVLPLSEWELTSAKLLHLHILNLSEQLQLIRWQVLVRKSVQMACSTHVLYLDLDFALSFV